MNPDQQMVGDEGHLNLTEDEMMALLPDFFDRFMDFFGPAHQEGVAPSRVKELARLKVAAIHECDT